MGSVYCIIFVLFIIEKEQMQHLAHSLYVLHAHSVETKVLHPVSYSLKDSLPTIKRALVIHVTYIKARLAIFALPKNHINYISVPTMWCRRPPGCPTSALPLSSSSPCCWGCTHSVAISEGHFCQCLTFPGPDNLTVKSCLTVKFRLYADSRSKLKIQKSLSFFIFSSPEGETEIGFF